MFTSGVGAVIVLRVIIDIILNSRADIAFLRHNSTLLCLLTINFTGDHVAQELLGLKASLDRTLLALLTRGAVVQEQSSLLAYDSVTLPIAALAMNNQLEILCSLASFIALLFVSIVIVKGLLRLRYLYLR